MYKSYDDYLVYSAINEFNTQTAIPDSVKNAASNVADKISDKSGDLVTKIKEEYKDKSFTQTIQHTYKIIKNSGVGEFAGDVGAGVADKLKSSVHYLSKKVGEYSVIGLLGVSILDFLAPFGMLDSFFGKIELKLGIAIIMSLIIYILSRKRK